MGCPRSAASGRGAGPRTGFDGVGKVRHLRAIPRGASVPRQRQQRSRPARLRISVREPAAAAAIEARGAHLRRVDLGDVHQEEGSEAEGVRRRRLQYRLHALCARAGSALRFAPMGAAHRADRPGVLWRLQMQRLRRARNRHIARSICVPHTRPGWRRGRQAARGGGQRRRRAVLASCKR